MQNVPKQNALHDCPQNWSFLDLVMLCPNLCPFFHVSYRFLGVVVHFSHRYVSDFFFLSWVCYHSLQKLFIFCVTLEFEFTQILWALIPCCSLSGSRTTAIVSEWVNDVHSTNYYTFPTVETNASSVGRTLIAYSFIDLSSGLPISRLTWFFDQLLVCWYHWSCSRTPKSLIFVVQHRGSR